VDPIGLHPPLYQLKKKYEVPLHPVKVGFWCAVSVRIVVLAFFTEIISKDIHV
jgi:hypothetical protein